MDTLAYPQLGPVASDIYAPIKQAAGNLVASLQNGTAAFFNSEYAVGSSGSCSGIVERYSEWMYDSVPGTVIAGGVPFGVDATPPQGNQSRLEVNMQMTSNFTSRDSGSAGVRSL